MISLVMLSEIMQIFFLEIAQVLLSFNKETEHNEYAFPSQLFYFI